jgi:CelD/BcsL family acetyltransferase involved in cellulose biosynthesis
MLLVPDSIPAVSTRLSAHVAGESDAPAIDARAWTALADDAAEPNAFAEHWFAGPALNHLAAKNRVRTIVVRDTEGVVAGIISLTTAPRYGRTPARHVTNWIHYQCFMGTPLVRRGHIEGFWRAVIELLDRSDWAPGFLSIQGLNDDGPVHRGLCAAARQIDRPCPTVHRYERAALHSDLSSDAYLERTVRSKKRKELRRLANRLADLGSVRFSTLQSESELVGWCEAFLALEASGWKGREGAAFARDPAMTGFFHDVMTGAFCAERLDFQRLDLDGRPIAMLINFRTPPGSWSFKIAHDDALARFSPGVLIELENLPRVLGDPAIDWMDSCAARDHPMINSLWAERRAIVQVSVPLSGARRRAIYAACRAAETGSSALRKAFGR